MKPSAVLFKAADIIEPAGAWGKGRGHCPPAGYNCHCIVTAIDAVTGISDLALLSAALAFVREAIGKPDVIAWNDAPQRTQGEAVSALRRAGTIALEAGQ